MNEWIVYLATGAVAGILAGLLGIGGGFVIVPALIFLLPLSGVPADLIMHAAIGTSLATICVTSISSFMAHHRKQSVDWVYVRWLAPGIIVGALGSGLVADKLSSQTLAWVFGIGALVMAVQIWLSRQPEATPTKPKNLSVFATSLGIGMGSGLVGIGGGSLVVPYLHFLGEKITKCVGTAAACGLPIALAGAASYAVVGFDEQMPEMSLGYIYLPAFLGIIVTSIVMAPLGAYFAHAIPAKQLKRVFAIFLAIVGVRIIWQNIA